MVATDAPSAQDSTPETAVEPAAPVYGVRERLSLWAGQHAHELTMVVPFAWLLFLPLAWTLALLPLPASLAALVAAGVAAWPLVAAVRLGRGVVRALFALVWLAVAASAGPDGVVLAGGVAGWWWWSSAWWRARRVLPVEHSAAPPAPEAPPAQPDLTPELDPEAEARARQAQEIRHLQELFTQRLSAPGKALAGTALTRPEPIAAGYRAEIHAVPGEKTFKELLAQGGKFASAYETTTQLAVLEQVAYGNDSRVMATWLRDDTLAQVRRFEDVQPRIQPDGRAHIGYFYDLQPAHWSFFTASGGVRHGIFSGDSDMGKSRSVESLTALAHQSEYLVPVIIDPQGGSMPVWNDVLRSALGEDEAYEELCLWDYVLRKQVQHIARVPWVDEDGDERRGKNCLLPGDPDLGGMPGVLLIFEEAPELLMHEVHGKRAVAKLSGGAKTWRKGGGGIIVVAQAPDSRELGGSVTLRAQLQKNACALRTTTPGAAYQMGIPHDPSTLPPYFKDGTPAQGLAYLNGVDQRATMMRWLYLAKPKLIARQPAGAQLHPITLGFMHDYLDSKKGRATQRTAGSGQTPMTAGDAKAAVLDALTAAGRPLEVGEVMQAVLQARPTAPPGEVLSALNRLSEDGRVWRSTSGGAETFTSVATVTTVTQ
ncbi:hypothetical protein ACIBH1_45705 [Nonomuraea sp. NPDC050663]|uniref:hypothetical protein n=1 Tax=Nonomuraea sp. NPDC050663 TaxID=3364370 RepID=UPI0037BA496A